MRRDILRFPATSTPETVQFPNVMQVEKRHDHRSQTGSNGGRHSEDTHQHFFVVGERMANYIHEHWWKVRDESQDQAVDQGLKSSLLLLVDVFLALFGLD